MAIAKVQYKENASATPEVWMDTTQKTVTAGSMLSGVTALKNDGTGVSGSIQSQAAQTIHPSSSDQTIASGKYLSGAQTIKAVALTNLTAANIKKDVVVKVGDSTDDDCVTSVTGTYEGTGGSPNIQSLSVTQNGTYTASGNVDGYSPVVVNVSGGGSTQKAVYFIDYDGTLLYSYTASEFANLSELPSNPSHTGLTAQGWNWSRSQIESQLQDYPNQPICVGQMYVTSSGATEIDITLDDSNYLSPYLMIAVNGTVSVDWGDNTTASTVTGSSTSTVAYTLHEYSSTGDYTIKIFVTSGSFRFLNGSPQPSVLSVYGFDTNKNTIRWYSDAVNEIRIGSGVTSIGGNAFRDCHALQSVTIPSSVTSIGDSAFYNCYALQSVTIPSGVTSIGGNAFRDCHALQSVTIPSGVTSIGGNAFRDCYALQSVTIPSGVTSIGSSAFSGCHALQSATIPSGVTSIGNSAFRDCYALQSVTIPSSVTSIGDSAFYNCYALQSVTIPPSGVTSIGGNAFQNCYALQSVTIPSGVTSIGNTAFSSCYTLQSIIVPNSVTSIGNSAFQYCYGMLEYHFQHTTPPTLGITAFSGIDAGTVIYVPSASLDAYKTATNWSTYASYMQGE